MQPESSTDHIALLSLMIAGTLIKRLNEVGQLDEATARQLHQLVRGVRMRARAAFPISTSTSTTSIGRSATSSRAAKRPDRCCALSTAAVEICHSSCMQR
ncbi:hypothetical protein SAMN06295937_10575 [Sphingopyxis flava]|uniref:Uncharacterized protein n=1 Tax=Sphingopyxis flava TaxID=1507287 RepID=A0A1T5G4I5_9SPHN|nr:hypothetical protein SAMN06295937_10575 [Sphingopyxis flava]